MPLRTSYNHAQELKVKIQAGHWTSKLGQNAVTQLRSYAVIQFCLYGSQTVETFNLRPAAVCIGREIILSASRMIV